MKLLYAEDEPAMSEAVVDILEYHNYIVDAVYDGAAALSWAQTGDYDGIILDIMMPKMDGLEVLKRLRASGCKTPILLLTAKSQVDDQVIGLDLGADDYLPKPFSMALLLARVRAMLRRGEGFTPDTLTFGDVMLNQSTGELSSHGNTVVLPKLEYQLMEVLMLSRGTRLSSEDLLYKVWGCEGGTDVGSVWVYISYLRKRLAVLGSNVTIVANRGIGYTLKDGE